MATIAAALAVRCRGTEDRHRGPVPARAMKPQIRPQILGLVVDSDAAHDGGLLAVSHCNITMECSEVAVRNRRVDGHGMYQVAGIREKDGTKPACMGSARCAWLLVAWNISRITLHYRRSSTYSKSTTSFAAINKEAKTSTLNWRCQKSSRYWQLWSMRGTIRACVAWFGVVDRVVSTLQRGGLSFLSFQRVFFLP